MARIQMEDGFGIDPGQDVPEVDSDGEQGLVEDRLAPPDLVMSSLRDAFVDAFNARDLEGLIALVSEDVDCPDLPGDGQALLADEVESIWERSPGAVLTAAHLEGETCAIAWLPDEEGCWSRAALVCFDAADGLLNLVSVPDDADALSRAQGAEPGDHLDEWLDWAEWDRGEETIPRSRERGEA